MPSYKGHLLAIKAVFGEDVYIRVLERNIKICRATTKESLRTTYKPIVIA